MARGVNNPGWRAARQLVVSLLAAGSFAACWGFADEARAAPRPLPSLDADAEKRNRGYLTAGLSVGAGGTLVFGAGLMVMAFADEDRGFVLVQAGGLVGLAGVLAATGACVRYRRHRIAGGEVSRPTARAHRWMLGVGWGLFPLAVTGWALTMARAQRSRGGGFDNRPAALAGIGTGVALHMASFLLVIAGHLRRRTARRPRVSLALGAAGTPWSAGLRIGW